MSVIEIITIIAATSASAAAPPQNPIYKPAVGDYIEVFRRTFKPAHFDRAKAEFIRQMNALENRDKLVRMSLTAENRSTGEVVALMFSDPFNRGRWRFGNRFSVLEKFEAQPVVVRDFRIFEMLDEGVRVKPGDTMKMYWHNSRPEAHDEMKRALAEKMLNSLRNDGYKTNGYFAETENAGELLGIGIGQFHNQIGKHSHAISHLKSKMSKPLQRDTFRVIRVHHERTL